MLKLSFLFSLIHIRPKVVKRISFRTISTKQIFNRHEVHTIPALQDNFMYLLIDKETKLAAAVDPVEPERVLNLVEAEGATLISILTTHHHDDHDGGNKLMTEKIRNLTVFGGDNRIDSMTSKLDHRDTFNVGNTLIECLQTPCHTSGHVCYFVKCELNPICFTGDTLFVGGCGRFFEGTAEHMINSLNILSSLPGCTKIFCGHEYSENNLKFAVAVEPNNQSAREKLNWVTTRIKNKEPSVPSTINEELSYNPFLRISLPSVQSYVGKTNPVEVMTSLRKAKDNFKG